MSSIMITIDIPDGAAVNVSNPNTEQRHEQTQSAQSNQDDPWGGSQATTSGSQQNAPASRSGPSGGSSGRPAGTVVDDRGKQWTFGASGAPDCQCGEPAAMVKGKSNGKPWSQWRCAKSYGDDWKNKCQYSEFVR